MIHTFDTMKAAIAAGYTRANTRTISEHRGVPLEARDVSGGRHYGYRFQLRVGGVVADSVHVHLTSEKTAGGGVGAICEMFEPGVVDEAIELWPEWVEENETDYLDYEA